MKVLVAINPFLTDTSKYKDIEFVVNPWGGDPTAEAIEKELAKNLYDGLIVGTKKVSNAIIETSPSLKVISRVGVGTDNIDIRYFKGNNIAITNTPNGPTDSTAEQALAFILSASRKIHYFNQELKNNKWNRIMFNRIKDCSIGIMGTGRIGRRVVDLLEPFQCRRLLYDIFQDSAYAQSKGLQYICKEDILKQSDIITLHCSLNEGTNDLIGQKEFEILLTREKPIILVNVARGALVNEDALYDFLKESPESIYCADVYWQEPYFGKLCELENTILTPHTSTFTYGAKLETEKQAIENCIAVLKGEQCENVL